MTQIAIPGSTIFAEAAPGATYVIGADPAEGNPQSDESAACVLDVATGEQVAVLGGRFEPATFAAHLASLAELYNGAALLVERNNHGHAVLLWLTEFSTAYLLNGLDGKPGWLSTGRGKPIAFDHAADCLRDGACVVRDRTTLAQLASIEGATLRAPAGQHDDRAMAFVLSLAAIRWGGGAMTGVASVVIPPVDDLDEWRW